MVLLPVLIFPACMIVAALTDLCSMTIPNRLQLALAGGFVLAALSLGLPLPVLGLHLATGALMLLLTFGCFAAGWMGGGDAKLIAATALWLGPTTALADYAMAATLYGGILTLLLLLARALLAPTTGIVFLDRLLTKTVGCPYGIALGLAGLRVFADTPYAEALAATFA
ncbi:peptidase [Aureimonas endophytica]|uniref:Peptidase n=1 Tax=Aureimonas endophytica TaxID=2027858 RepID=A0A916ZS08_9HYPH|nr:prepilin peptidase [Aureimonas endophytica]GGE09608.1 peptidase [Aureimonas endophytica]